LKLSPSGRKFITIFLVGLAIRLVLAPITAHGDLGHSAFTAHWTVDLGQNIYDKEFPGSLGFNFPPLWLFTISGIYLLWETIFKPHTLVTDAISISDKSLIFLLKIPLILADVFIMFIIFAILRKRIGEDKALVASTLWFLNPFVIFIDSIWGQFDVLATLCTVLSLYYFSEKRFWRSAIWLGIGAAWKTYPLLLIPFLGLVHLKDGKARDLSYFVFFSLLPLSIVSIPYLAMSPKRYLLHLLTMSTKSSPEEVFWIFGPSLWRSVPLTLTGILLTLLYAYHQGVFKDLISVNSFILTPFLIFFALSTWNPQFLVWIIPFLAIDYSSRIKLQEIRVKQVMFLFIIASAFFISFYESWPPYLFFYPLNLGLSYLPISWKSILGMSTISLVSQAIFTASSLYWLKMGFEDIRPSSSSTQ
jgi:hypothetical protein